MKTQNNNQKEIDYEEMFKRHTGVLMEHVNEGFKVLAEGQEVIIRRMDKNSEDIEGNKQLSTKNTRVIGALRRLIDRTNMRVDRIEDVIERQGVLV